MTVAGQPIGIEDPAAIEQQVREVVAAHGRLPVAIDTVAERDDLFRLGLTSHASVNVMLALEDGFDVEFPEALLTKAVFQSIAAMRDAVSGLMMEEATL